MLVKISCNCEGPSATEIRTLSVEKLHLLPFLTLGMFVQSTLLWFSQLYEYLAIDSGGYLCMNSLQ